MKNPVGIAKKSYNRILKIDDLICQLEQLTDTQTALNNKIDSLNQQIINQETLFRNLENQNIYLKHLICANFDIEKVPKAVGRVRLMQKANFKLLLIIKDICEKNNLEFYLNFGSLLGAIRHKGYIPWDDDIDIMMIREDYDKFLKLLDKYFKNTKLFYTHSEIIRVFYADTPLQVDIFPSDFYPRAVKNEKDRIAIGTKLHKIHNENIIFDWEKLKTQERTITNLSYSDIKSLKKRLVGPEISKKEAKKIHPAIFHGIEKSSIRPTRSIQDYDWIYPLKKTLFEGVEMPIPNQPDYLLNHYYHDFMSWPPSFYPKHNDIQSRLTEQSIRTIKAIINDEIKMTEKTK